MCEKQIYRFGSCSIAKSLDFLELDALIRYNIVIL